ncbi:putative ABC transporter ATP-binding protein [Candidatus Brocadiaceae bacterium B188]|nr:ABC transporter ATP-binding protein [Candidatus Brocadia sapporoensis]QQR66084.1 MAG: ABC transporter ATP-binding protein [Candidatus Brocadia sp.]RZV57693.1 MAG: ABC transporter ATP-binding protein [Candidatus Brocadia sp. BROELEC01]TWU53002.1 putative ABC transporter ATP-binding protein [Candidatus Brocadiaceae bacterium B188]
MDKEEFFTEDVLADKIYDRAVIRKLLSHVLRYKTSGLLSVFIVLITTVLFLLCPYLFGYAIDHGISKGDTALLYKTAFAILGIETLRLLLVVVQSYNIQAIGQKVMLDIRMELFRHVQSLPVSFFDKNPVGRVVTRLTNDIAAIGELFSAGVIVVIGDIFIIIGIFVAMIMLNWKLAIITLSVFPIIVIIALWFGKHMKSSFREIRRKLASINAYLNENITGMKVIQLFNREKRNYAKFDAINDDYLKEQVKYIRYFAIFQPAINMVNALAVGLVIWYGAARYMHGFLTLGVLVSFLAYIHDLFDPIRDIVEKYNIFQGAMASSERVFGLMEEPAEIDYAISNPAREVPLKDFKGEIEFQNIWFAYHKNDYVLKDISFHIKPGQSVALVGVTGSGKTSIASILTRLYETQKGTILLDRIDIRNIEKTGLRYVVGLVSQDVFLFAGTLRDNITLFNPMSDTKVLETIEVLGLMPFIDRMPGGLDMEIAERGANLSVGERQFISLSRIILYDPQVIILDEATSSMDTISEVLIQNALLKATRDRTSIFIAHRLSTILHCDKIIVLSRGEKVEEGSHEELLRFGGLYSQLYKMYIKENLIEHG